MKLSILEKNTFYICGFYVETNASQNDKDIESLYHDFFDGGNETNLLELPGKKSGYYGLTWYTQGHEKYCYLLGFEVDQSNSIPQNALLKEIPKAKYAMVSFAQGTDIIEAWTEFFYKAIPQAGYSVNEDQNLYFEYYPDSVNGSFELWVPVVKTNG